MKTKNFQTIHPDHEEIRKETKKLLIDLQLDVKQLPKIAELVSTPGDVVSKATISYAITGHRRGNRYYELLVYLREQLLSILNRQVA